MYSSLQLAQLLSVVECKVITKSKVGSHTMQPAKHDVTGMPLYPMYPYPIHSVRYGCLYIPFFYLLIQYRKLFWKVLKNSAEYREILPKVLRINLKIFKRKIGTFREFPIAVEPSIWPHPVVRSHCYDLVLYAHARTSKTIASAMNSAHSSISQWQSDHHLETAAQNSEALVDTRGGNIKKPPPILLQGTVVTPSSTLWYLGMHLDCGLAFWQYINGVFTGVFTCWRAACEDAGPAEYSQLHLHVTGDYNRQQAVISCQNHWNVAHHHTQIFQRESDFCWFKASKKPRSKSSGLFFMVLLEGYCI